MLETKKHQTIRRRPKKTHAMLFAVVLLVQCMMPSAHAAITMETAGNAANRISVGWIHSLALKADGSVAAWGRNIDGQCNVPSSLTDVVAVAAGMNHSLALKSNGTVVAWGRNLYGQCNVPSDLSDVVAIAAGSSTSLALKANGTVVGWGDSGSGGSVPSDLSDVVAISAHFHLYLALKSDGTVVAWGWNSHGECNVPSDLKDVVAIAAGQSHALALKSDGTVVAWGDEDDSSGISDLTDVVAIAAGSSHSLALKSDGTVVACGGFYDEGNVPSDLSDVVAIAAGQFWSLALKADGTIVTWGDNFYNQRNVPSGLKLGSRLTDILINNGALPFDFKPGTFSYALSVPDDYVSIGISPFADDDIQIKVQGETKASGSTTDISLSPGETIVTIDAIEPDTSLTTTYTLTVTLKKPVDSVTLSSNNETMIHHDTLTLTATVLPEDATYPDVTWESEDDAVATVDTNGNVKAMGVGSTTVTATADGVSDTCDITVNEKPVTGVTLSPESHTLGFGDADTSNDTVTLTTTVTPYNATDSTVSYQSSDTSVATVDENGVVTAVDLGTATITVTTTDGGHTDECAITVARLVTGLSVTPETSTLILGDADTGNDTVTIIPTIEPDDATDQTVSYESSDPSAATVDENGVVTAVKRGTATITVTTTDGGYTDTCFITVEQRVTGVSVTPETSTLVLGDADTSNDTVSVSATVSPADANDKTFTWESSDPAVATVDASGVVTAVGGGSATITATTTDGGHTDECAIAVERRVTGVTLPSDYVWMTHHDTLTLTATVLPDDATYSGVTWSSDNTAVVKVDTNGKLTAVDVGHATITATAGGQSDSCVVVVTAKRVAGVRLNEYAKTLAPGDSFTLKATILPQDATSRNITWASSDGSVATVNRRGKVTAVGIGTATISAKTHGAAAFCTVTVAAEKAAAPATPAAEDVSESSPISTPSPEPAASPTPVPTESAEPSASPSPALAAIPVRISDHDDETGLITFEIDVSALPEGTKALQMPDGTVIEIGDGDTLEIMVTQSTLDGEEVELLLLDDEGLPMAPVVLQAGTDTADGQNDGRPIFLWLLIGIVGIGGAGATFYLLWRKGQRA